MKVEINPQWLTGPWRAGWSLDLHTVSSEYLPEGEFATERTQLGEWLYLLKYRGDRHKLNLLAEAAANFLKRTIAYPYLSGIIPVPPSEEREFQPVIALAQEIGKKTNLKVAVDYIVKIKPTQPVKNIEDNELRKRELRGAFDVKDLRFKGKNVLLFDDIYRSGETLSAITEVLMQKGRVRKVFVLTITKTRVKR